MLSVDFSLFSESANAILFTVIAGEVEMVPIAVFTLCTSHRAIFAQSVCGGGSFELKALLPISSKLIENILELISGINKHVNIINFNMAIMLGTETITQ